MSAYGYIRDLKRLVEDYVGDPDVKEYREDAHDFILKIHEVLKKAPSFPPGTGSIEKGRRDYEEWKEAERRSQW